MTTASISPSTELNFDTLIDRRPTSATKWAKYPGRDILPFWVADMDLATPAFIRSAIAERLAHPILGYTDTPDALTEAACGWLLREHQWQVAPESVVWLPGVVPGLNLAARAILGQGDSLAVPVPVYYPFRDVAANAGSTATELPLRLERDGDQKQWVMDLAQWSRVLPKSARLLLLCNPQNPTGRAYSRDELEQLLAFCEVHNMSLCSDEIHCDLVLDANTKHVPIASLSEAFAQRTISLFAPTKTFNLPGLGCAFAVIPNATLRANFKQARAGLVPSPGPLAFAAADAAFAHNGQWLTALRAYLRKNQRQLHSLVEQHLPGRMTPVEATYLGWLDLREFHAQHQGQAAAALESFGLGLSDGEAFGSPGFVRFNFACPTALLSEGLLRLDRALGALTQG